VLEARIVAGPEPSELALERFHASLDLVDVIAQQCLRSVGHGVELDDLRSWGREGLLVAAGRYDASREVPFRSYASFRVRGAMIDGMRRSSQLPRRTFRRLRMMEAALEYSEGAAQDLMGPPPPGETREDAQRLLDEHLASMATAMAVGLVNVAATGEEGEYTAKDTGESPEELVERRELHDLLSQQLAELPHQERELVRRHYFEGERFDHVAADLGLSKSWASRLHTRAIGRLSKRLRGQG
jgi:RNA polymerase sigma factor for flagellar operon FliA